MMHMQNFDDRSPVPLANKHSAGSAVRCSSHGPSTYALYLLLLLIANRFKTRSQQMCHSHLHHVVPSAGPPFSAGRKPFALQSTAIECLDERTSPARASPRGCGGCGGFCLRGCGCCCATPRRRPDLKTHRAWQRLVGRRLLHPLAGYGGARASAVAPRLLSDVDHPRLPSTANASARGMNPPKRREMAATAANACVRRHARRTGRAIRE